MSVMKLCCVLAVGIIFRQTAAQCIGRIRTVVPAYPQQTLVPAYPQPVVSTYPPPCTSCKNEELGAALILAQLLSDKEERANYSNQPSTSNSSPVYTSGNLNVEDIIMKLVNALIYTTTQTGGRSTNTGGSSSSSGGSGGSGNLVDLDLLGKNGNLLGLGLGGQGVLGVGVGQ